jgi:uncharacterized RDD family membrane protein YckC
MSLVAEKAAGRPALAQGTTAGFVTRFSANLLDAVVLCMLWASGLLLTALVRYMARPSRGFHLPVLPGWVTGVIITAAAITYLTLGWSSTGRSIGKRVAGLRVVTAGGGSPSSARALLRAALCVVFPVGFGWALFSRQSRSVQDYLVATTVVYDWGIAVPRAAS